MQFYAKDIMSENLITVRPEMSCEEVMDLFFEHHISGAPVLDKNNALVGVISMTDVIKSGLNFPYSHNFFEDAQLDRIIAEEGFHIEEVNIGFVSDYMTPHVHTALPDTPVEELAKTMYQKHIHRIIILDPSTSGPVGIVSTFDLLKLMAEAGSTLELQA